MNNSEAAKNLLVGTSCYDCRHYIGNNKCIVIHGLIPPEIYCNRFYANTDFNLEEALIKSMSTEIKKEIDREALRKING